MNMIIYRERMPGDGEASVEDDEDYDDYDDEDMVDDLDDDCIGGSDGKPEIFLT
jgi:hypothetical protein